MFNSYVSHYQRVSEVDLAMTIQFRSICHLFFTPNLSSLLASCCSSRTHLLTAAESLWPYKPRWIDDHPHRKKGLIYVPYGYDYHSHGIDGPNRNRWFTVLNSMVIFHGYVTNNQMVYNTSITQYIYIIHTTWDIPA